MSQSVGRNIPLPVQRVVRQRCGFGCVICGLPLYEYEHMLGYAEVLHLGRNPHVAEEITLLCDQHHREKTTGLLPPEKVREANERPYNHQIGVSKPYNFHYSGQTVEVTMGSNSFSDTDTGTGSSIIPVMVDSIPLIGFILQDDHLLLNLNLFDEYNEPILRIKNNELLYSVSPWDINLVGRNLVIREAERQILIDITFEVPNKISINRGRLLCNGVEILIRPDYLLITNNGFMMSGLSMTNFTAGLVVGKHESPPNAMIHQAWIPRYLGDRAETVRWARESMRNERGKSQLILPGDL